MMNPLLASALSKIVRWLLLMGVPFFVTNGIWTPDESTAYVAGATNALVALIWSLWEAYGTRVNFINALWSDPMRTTEAQVKAMSSPDIKNLLQPWDPNPRVK